MDQEAKAILTRTVLEEAGRNGWPCYRIPGIVVTAAGTLLAYYETRLDGHDWHARAIGLRRSADGGRSWSDRREITGQQVGQTINNPVMIAMRSGRVIFFYEENYKRFFQLVSDDDGLTWSVPVEQTDVLAAFRNTYAWTAFGLGPCHGLEMDSGRLLLPVWLCNGGGRAHRPSVVTTLASDDSGRTWSCGQILPLQTQTGETLVNPSETAIVMSRDGSVLANLRHETERRRRALAFSCDGTTAWSFPRFAEDLPDPVCCAGMVRIPGLYRAGASSCLAFSNCATEGPARENLTIKVSCDDGLSWQPAGLLAGQGGYSDLAISPDGQWLYCFYEENRKMDGSGVPARLTLVRVNQAWLNQAINHEASMAHGTISAGAPQTSDR